MNPSFSDVFQGQKLRIGTRGSALARAQAGLFSAALQAAFPQFAEKGALEVVIIRASGDYRPGEEDTPLYGQGGKGLFTRELEMALDEGQIDVAVHSIKDVPAFIEDRFALTAVLPREDPRDVFVSEKADTPEALPKDSLIGTSSPRRRAQVLIRWPHLKPVPLRGNVDTRLDKLSKGQVQGMFLAYAGLKRLGRTEKITRFMSVEEMLPCVGQGVVGFEILKKKEKLAEMLARLNHAETFTALRAERAMLQTLNGNCDTPIAGLARIKGQEIVLDGLVAHPEGKGLWQARGTAPLSEAVALGREVGQELRLQTPPGILPDEIKRSL
ncbi:MAG: hydroxymethylbilane synthase [Proteobacteria bacterium]|nr:hydroxymethylbilane synthase [Pseudomonadota bacterium]